MMARRIIVYSILGLALLAGGCQSGQSRSGPGLISDVGPPPGLNESQLEPLEGDALTRATARLKQTMVDNLRAIGVAKTFNERLIRALGEAVAESRPSTNAYTAAGSPTPTVTPATPSAITLDDRI